MKRFASIAALALAGGLTLTACGGAPTDASEDDFCDAVEGAATDITEAATSGDEDTEIDLDDAIDTLNETGTPEGISDDARNGFEVYVDALGEINGETIADLNEQAEENDSGEPVEVSEDDKDDFDAFNEYVASTCA